MNDKELEEWVNKNPMLANCVYPVIFIAGAMFIQFSCIQLINWLI